MNAALTMNTVLDTLPQWHYMAAMLFCLAATLPLEVVIGARVYRQGRRAALTIAVAAAPFVVWDLLATRAGHWRFSDTHTLRFRLGGLPAEEIAFFVVIPLCALLTYEAVGVIWAKRGS